MKIYVLRHGITELNKKKIVNGQIDEPLAPEGIEQANSVISLIPNSIQHIYSSSLLRAKQTAEIINSTVSRPLSFQKELSEIHMGSLAGHSWEEMEMGAELKKKHRSLQFDYRPFGGESTENVKKRIIKFLREINHRHDEYGALLVTHGGVIRFLNWLERGEISFETEEHVSLLSFDLEKIMINNQN
jgi:broad specificity phosphatase PhoE